MITVKNNTKYNKLTPEEERVIRRKGTEGPASGKYDNFYENGVYICRQCNAPLYRSEDKFKPGCGWPSFDDEIPGAVKREADPDGARTEITCHNCGGHLGHVFTGEKHTAKDTRHCVNSTSLRFVPRDFINSQTYGAVLGGGCFWCLEAAFGLVKGVVGVVSGYAGGNQPNPTYEAVSAGNTGHAEVVKAEYDPREVSFSEILEVFFTVHDPTALNRQGNDLGEQYRSIILYQTWRQREEAERLIKKLNQEKIYKEPAVTELEPLLKFYPAEDYHQQYFKKNPDQSYCTAVISPKLSQMREKVAKLLKG